MQNLFSKKKDIVKIKKKKQIFILFLNKKKRNTLAAFYNRIILVSL
jgi:hypothetical protein